MSTGLPLEQRLLAAAADGDLDLIKSLYGSLSSADQTESLQKIAQSAARHGHADLLEWCFSQGLSFPAESVNHDLYHAACDGGSPAIFQVLVNHGTDLNAHWSEYDGDALVVAARTGNVPLARFLLEHGQDPNSGHCCSDAEAIHWAITGDNASLEIIRLMLSHGLRLEGTGAAVAAAEVDNLEALELLLDSGAGAGLEDKAIWWPVTDKESVDSEGTALYRACRAGKIRTARCLLDRGADPNATDRVGRSCLAVAQERGHQDIVDLLRERGATG
ncbi:hypothetical protein VTN77DRAFT_2020 [Rasamsonia byssochlamydoides]|uniref:uncharacterized protein n=1 Tax=Rasamsonia byssochlamydoides TaxID=89139 RepID=UPI003742CFB3